MPKTLKIVLTWQNFAKSDHSEYKQCSQKEFTFKFENIIGLKVEHIFKGQQPSKSLCSKTKATLREAWLLINFLSIKINKILV